MIAYIDHLEARIAKMEEVQSKMAARLEKVAGEHAPTCGRIEDIKR